MAIGLLALGPLTLSGPAGASQVRTETLTFTVPTPVVLNVEHQMSIVHHTTKLALIWNDALCDAPAEPIPTQGHSTGVTVHFSVTLVRAKVKALTRQLAEYGCGTLRHDYLTSLGRFEQRLAQESGLTSGSVPNSTT